MAPRRTERVLLYRLGSLGDHLVALPSYRLVSRAFPEAERKLLTNFPVAQKAAPAEAVLQGSGLVDGYFSYGVGLRSPWRLLRLICQIRRWRPAAVVYLAGARGVKAARRDRAFFHACGIRRQIGVPLAEDMQRSRPCGERDGAPRFEGEGERLARCIAELGDARLNQPASWEPGLTEAERTAAATLIAPLGGTPFFAFSIGTKVQANRWGLDRWQALLQKVAAEWPGFGLVVVGAADEFAESETVAAAWRTVPGAGPALNLCGAAAPRVSAAVMQRASMFFGQDSGPAHMAAAVGTPVLGIYSARMLPGTWVPHGEHVRVVLHWVDCGGCQLETCIVQNKKCIYSIGVEEAMEATRSHWSQMSRRREAAGERLSAESVR